MSMCDAAFTVNNSGLCYYKHWIMDCLGATLHKQDTFDKLTTAWINTFVNMFNKASKASDFSS